jgi:hypothetical protein
MRNVSDESCRENRNTHFMISFFFENCAVYEIMWKKYCRTGQATDDNVADAHCMLDTQGYKYTYTHRTCNIYCISTTSIVAQARLNVTFHVLCLSCSVSTPKPIDLTSYIVLRGGGGRYVIAESTFHLQQCHKFSMYSNAIYQTTRRHIPEEGNMQSPRFKDVTNFSCSPSFPHTIHPHSTPCSPLHILGSHTQHSCPSP